MAPIQPSIHFSLELFSWNKAVGALNHSPPSTAEFNKEWSCTCAPPICLHVVAREYQILEIQIVCDLTLFRLVHRCRSFGEALLPLHSESRNYLR